MVVGKGGGSSVAIEPFIGMIRLYGNCRDWVTGDGFAERCSDHAWRWWSSLWAWFLCVGLENTFTGFFYFAVTSSE